VTAATFLSFDGIDGTGKSTQCKMLVEWLRNCDHAVTACVDPGGTDIGAKLREILLHARTTRLSAKTEALLFMASRAELVDEIIRPALARGDIVVSDRYLLANVVYQAHAGGLNSGDLWSIGEFATGGILPDLTLLFDLPLEAARARRGHASDRIESRGDDYDAKVRDGFLLEATNPVRRIAVIDAAPMADVVHRNVLEIVVPFLQSRGHKIEESSRWRGNE